MNKKALNNLVLHEIKAYDSIRKLNYEDLRFSNKIHDGFTFSVYDGTYMSM